MELPICGIYEILCLVTGHKYIGSSKNIRARWSAHRILLKDNKSSCVHLQRAWLCYGASAFAFFIIEECHKDRLIVREQFYIDVLKPELNIVKNVDIPPFTGRVHSEKTKLKMSRNNGMKRPEVCAKFSGDNNPMKRPEMRKWISENTPFKRIEIRKQNSDRQKSLGDNHPSKRPELRMQWSINRKGKNGRSPSQKTREKISLANKGRKVSVETRAKMSAAKKGKKKGPMPLETRIKLSNTMNKSEMRAKLSKALKGNQHLLGHTHSSDSRKKMIMTRLERGLTSLTPTVVHEIRKLNKEKMPKIKISRELNITVKTVFDVISGRCWSWLI